MSTFLVIDGTDGAGKATQTKLLAERLKSEGLSVETIEFPQYTQNTFGKLIRECLDGEHGDFLSVDPKIASTLYAADRFESKSKIKEWLAAGKVVIADRYVSANMLHQGAKIDNDEERTAFLGWLDHIEHDIFGVPKPDMIVYLQVPYAIRQQLLQGDDKRATLDSAELDEAHQVATEAAATSLVAERNNWQSIDCTAAGSLRSKEDIHEEIYQHVQTVLN